MNFFKNLLKRLLILAMCLLFLITVNNTCKIYSMKQVAIEGGKTLIRNTPHLVSRARRTIIPVLKSILIQYVSYNYKNLSKKLITGAASPSNAPHGNFNLQPTSPQVDTILKKFSKSLVFRYAYPPTHVNKKTSISNSSTPAHKSRPDTPLKVNTAPHSAINSLHINPTPTNILNISDQKTEIKNLNNIIDRNRNLQSSSLIIPGLHTVAQNMDFVDTKTFDNKIMEQCINNNQNAEYAHNQELASNTSTGLLLAHSIISSISSINQDIHYKDLEDIIVDEAIAKDPALQASYNFWVNVTLNSITDIINAPSPSDRLEALIIFNKIELPGRGGRELESLQKAVNGIFFDSQGNCVTQRIIGYKIEDTQKSLYALDSFIKATSINKKHYLKKLSSVSHLSPSFFSHHIERQQKAEFNIYKQHKFTRFLTEITPSLFRDWGTISKEKVLCNAYNKDLMRCIEKGTAALSNVGAKGFELIKEAEEISAYHAPKEKYSYNFIADLVHSYAQQHIMLHEGIQSGDPIALSHATIGSRVPLYDQEGNIYKNDSIAQIIAMHNVYGSDAQTYKKNIQGAIDALLIQADNQMQDIESLRYEMIERGKTDKAYINSINLEFNRHIQTIRETAFKHAHAIEDALTQELETLKDRTVTEELVLKNNSSIDILNRICKANNGYVDLISQIYDTCIIELDNQETIEPSNQQSTYIQPIPDIQTDITTAGCGCSQIKNFPTIYSQPIPEIDTNTTTSGTSAISYDKDSNQLITVPSIQDKSTYYSQKNKNAKADSAERNHFTQEEIHKRRQESKKIAKEMGFKETKDYKFDAHGEKVYKKGKDYITFDKTSHKGGFWKVFIKETRQGTYDKYLQISIGD